MARTNGIEPTLDLRPLIHHMGVRVVLEQIGIERVIEQVWIQIRSDEFGFQNLIKEIGIDKFAASLSPKQRREMLTLLENDDPENPLDTPAT